MLSFRSFRTKFSKKVHAIREVPSVSFATLDIHEIPRFEAKELSGSLLSDSSDPGSSEYCKFAAKTWPLYLAR